MLKNDFLEVPREIENARTAILFITAAGLVGIVLSVTYFGQRAFCELLPLELNCREFPPYFVVILGMFVPQVLMLLMAWCATFGVTLQYMAALLAAGVTAVLFDVGTLLIATLVLGLKDYGLFFASTVFNLVVALLVTAITAASMVMMTRWNKKHVKQLERALGSKLKMEQYGRMPKPMVRSLLRLFKVSRIDSVLVLLFFLSMVVFTILPSSWLIIKSQYYTLVLMFTLLHTALFIMQRAVLSSDQIYEQLQQTVKLPLTNGLVLNNIIFTLVDLVFCGTAFGLLVFSLETRSAATPFTFGWAIFVTVVVALFVVVDLLYVFSLVNVMDGLKEVEERQRGMLGKADLPAKLVEEVVDLRANQTFLMEDVGNMRQRQNRIRENQAKIKENQKELQEFHLEEPRKRR